MRITEVLQTSVAGAGPVASTKFRVSTDYDGELRKLFAAICVVCDKEFWAPLHVLADGRKCCDRQCFGIFTRRRVTLTCCKCGTMFERKMANANRSPNGLVFCSRICKDDAQRFEGPQLIKPSHYKDGFHAYRERAFRHYGARCEECGYNEHEQMLYVNHRDGDRTNNKIENLQVLCVWHHAWITRMIQRLVLVSSSV